MPSIVSADEEVEGVVGLEVGSGAQDFEVGGELLERGLHPQGGETNSEAATARSGSGL